MKKKVLGLVGALEIELEGIEDTVIMILSGQIDSYTSEEINKIISSYIDKGNLKLIIDLSNVVYLDSAGLSALISCKTKICEKKGDLKLVGLKGKAREVFKLAGVTQMFDIYESRDVALDALTSP